MKENLVEIVKNNPHYQELVTKRTSFSLMLTIVMLVIYYAFILIIAFNKELFGATLFGGVTTVGIPVGIGIIVISFILTGIYVKRANSEFDELTKKIIDDVKKRSAQ
ncbi:MAG: DUF485 domain-containing protein [Campylobacterales bacterium]